MSIPLGFSSYEARFYWYKSTLEARLVQKYFRRKIGTKVLGKEDTRLEVMKLYADVC